MTRRHAHAFVGVCMSMFLTLFTVFAMPAIIQAASSGCHRWHSCPSTTSSYVCGDLGYCSQCPNNDYCKGGVKQLSSPSTVETPAAAQPSGTWVPLKQTKKVGCMAKNGLPDPACTPGALLSVTATDVCKPGYASSVRDVSTSTKNADFAEYGVISHPAGTYEIDHLISLELGGSNDISNLFPEAALPVPGFHEKDKVENYLHAQVCSGAISLNEAQKEIATNWLAVWRRQFSLVQ